MASLQDNQLDVIEDVLSRPFSCRSVEDKLNLVNMNVPRPNMDNLKTAYNRKGKTIIRNFNPSSYETKWLCGSEKLQKLFCWPCLLFRKSGDKGMWSRTGYNDLSHLSTAIKVHAASRDHIDNAMAFHTFGKIRIDEAIDHGREVQRNNHNILVRKNREGMTKLIEIVCYLASHGLSFRGHDESNQSSNRGNYRDLCAFLADHDPEFNDFISKSMVFSGASATTQNELITIIGEMMIAEMVGEVQHAECIAVMVDETTDNSRKSQLATTLRYCLKNGKVVERLVQIEDVSEDKSAAAIAEHVMKTLSNFKITAEKLVAQTYHGARVMSGDTGGTQALVKENFPNAYYIHCQAHVLNLVLLHACTNNPQTKKFFSTLSSLASFFSQSPKRDCELNKFMQKKIPNVCKVKWAYNSRMVNVVEHNYSEILSCLGEMYLGETVWDGETCAMARGLHGFLLDFDTVFFLKVFSEIFCFTDMLYLTLQSKELDFVACTKSVNETKFNITKLQGQERFDDILTACFETAGISNDHRHKYTKYYKVYCTLLQRILKELDTRFKDLHHFSYSALLDCSKFVSYDKTFPKDPVDNFCNRFKSNDKAKLINELKVLYTKDDFKGKTVSEIVAYIHDTGLEDIFSEVFKLGKQILCLPSTTASVERSFSVMRRVKSYLRSTMTEDRLKWLMIMSVEQKLLQDMQKTAGFYDMVIDRYAKRSDRRIPLMYK